jgi:hypothetical protein
LNRRDRAELAGVEPDLDRATRSEASLEMLPGVAHLLPFGNQSFDCVTTPEPQGT